MKISKWPFIIINGVIVPVMFLVLFVTSPLEVVEKSIVIVEGFLIVEIGFWAIIVISIYEWHKHKERKDKTL